MSTIDFPTNTLHGSETFGSYVLLDDVKNWLQMDVTDTSHDFALQMVIDAVCTRIQRFCDRPIAKTLYGPPFGVFDGGAGVDGSFIVLPRFPVLELVAVTEYQGNTGVALNEIDPGSGGDGYRVDYRTGTLTRITGGVYPRPWLPGTASVFVEWYAGMDPVPSDIWYTTAELIRQWYIVSQQALAGTRPAANGQANSTPYPGVPAWVKGQLADYIVPSIA